MSHFNKIAGQNGARMESLSDGVFSISMTLMVFNLKVTFEQHTVSDYHLLAQIRGLLPTLLTYFLSFMTLGIFWLGQSTQFHYIQKYDRNLVWYSMFFLLTVSLVPFTANILGNHITNRVSVGLYWLNLMALGTSLYLHWRYAFRNGFVTLENGAERELLNQAIKHRIIQAQILYTGAALLCLINPLLSVFAIIAIQLNYAFALFHPKAPTQAVEEAETS